MGALLIVNRLRAQFSGQLASGGTRRLYLCIVVCATVSVAVSLAAQSNSNSISVNELSGTVREVCGPVLPGTSVLASNGSGATARRAADERGHYSFSTLPSGQWTITFALPGFESLQQDLRIPQNGEPSQLNVRLFPDLLLKQELTVSDEHPAVRYRRYSVHGVVKAPTGEPVSGAIVRLEDVGAKKSRPISPCTTDELGRYAATAWSPVETMWLLSVESVGFRSYTHPSFTLAPDEPQDIDLRLEK